MQGLGLSFFTQFILFYSALFVGTVVVASMKWGLGSVNGQMVILLTLVIGIPGVWKIVSDSRK
jgi:putative effector of murein hydrolase LrgA (UPF0299 family)